MAKVRSKGPVKKNIPLIHISRQKILQIKIVEKNSRDLREWRKPISTSPSHQDHSECRCRDGETEEQTQLEHVPSMAVVEPQLQCDTSDVFNSPNKTQSCWVCEFLVIVADVWCLWCEVELVPSQSCCHMKQQHMLGIKGILPSQKALGTSSPPSWSG